MGVNAYRHRYVARRRAGHAPIPLRLTHDLVGRIRDDSLARNSLYIMATTAVTSLLGYLYWIVVACACVARDVGLAAALIAAMTLAANLAGAGIGPALVQALPRKTDGRAWSLTLTAGLAAGVCAALAVGLLIAAGLPLLSPAFASVAHSAVFGLLVVAGVTLWSLATLLDQTFVAARAAGYMLVRNLLFAALKVLLLMPALLMGGTGWLGIIRSWVLAIAVAALAGLLLIPRLKRGYRPVVRGVSQEMRTLLPSLAGHHAINVGGMAPMYLLPAIVTVRLSTADNAYFYATWMLGGLVFMISPAVASALFAEGSHATGTLARQARSAAICIAALLGPASAIILLAGHHVLAVFGPAYSRHGSLLLALLILSAVPDAITNITVSVLRVQGRLGHATILNCGMAALTLGLAWALLPSLGIAGAGWAWLCAQTMGSLVVGADLCVVRRARTRSRGWVVSSRDDVATSVPVARGVER